MTRAIFATFLAFLSFLALMPQSAHAFCGFYVSRADTDLFNEASKVVIARAGDRTVITMANDFKGDVKDFAIVIPVPTVITEGQVNVTESGLIDHLDAYTAPRLVEYFDRDPCEPALEMQMMRATSAVNESAAAFDMAKRAEALGVTIEAEYTVGEYDIVILSAEQSGGLLTFLRQENYRLPNGAKRILNSYIKQDMKFFLAKVNLEEQAKSGYTYLRPLQVAFEDEKFMLPIRLGTLNAQGDQELILFTLTRKGRVETTNYRTVKIPSNVDIPLYVEEDFGGFYKAMFRHTVEREQKKAVLLEYAWDMSWCDPCAADPLPPEDLRTLGAWWIESREDDFPVRPGRPIRPMPAPGQPRRPGIAPIPSPGPVDAFVTRLHLRYNAETFPEDLKLQETADRQNFQGRYVLRRPFEGEASCKAGREYFRRLPGRFEEEAQNLARMTGWEINEIRENMEEHGQSFAVDIPGKQEDARPWWEKMWE